MDWKYLIHHVISGMIPVTAGFLLYQLVLYLLNRKETKEHIAVSYLFCLYLTAVLTLTGITATGTFAPDIVLVPFRDMISGPVDTFLNVLLFIPMGMFLPLLYEEYDSIGKAALTGFLISLSVETAQLFVGTTDINDLITNTAGACLGYGIYCLLKRTVPEMIQRTQIRGKQCDTELLIYWFGCTVLMAAVQKWIFHILFPAG